MKQRLNLVTLGVADLARARRFYEALGWATGAAPEDDVVFFQAGEMVVALWDREKLATDSCVEDMGGWGGVTLAVNLSSPAEVDAVTEEARTAGATIGREPAETFWGGYSSLFLDPDGHPWEVAHNPRWTITENGGVRLPCDATSRPEGRLVAPSAKGKVRPGDASGRPAAWLRTAGYRGSTSAALP